MTRPLSQFLVLSAAAAGCGQIYEYPTPSEESGAAACADGDDGDFDGLTDCADPDCDGYCPELGRSECNDGRDNDGDGLVDAADPSCWLVEPPKAQRCADSSGVELIASFDTPPQVANESSDLGFWPWRAFGNSYFGPVVTEGFHTGPERSDGSIRFLYNRNEQGGAIRGIPDVFARSLGVLVRQTPFAGSWRDFELSFGLSVPERAMLRAAVLPIELAGSADAPPPGATNALLSVTVDTTSSPGALVLGVEGALYGVDLPAAPACHGVPCLSRLNVALERDGFRSWLVFADGTQVEVSGSAPSSPSLPPARLVFWGGTATEDETPVSLDDVRLKVAPEQPCGFSVPQIQENSCRAEQDLEAYGQTVSVTRSAAGEYCALVAASRPSPGPVLPVPEALTTWTSTDGEAWRPAAVLGASRLRFPEHAELIGGGIASSDLGLHAVVTYREGGKVRLGFLGGSGCADWGELARGPELFDDAESASYVVRGTQREVYFTRAPGRSQRTLWRLDLDSPQEPELVAELPAFVQHPVSVQRVGDADLVLTYPETTALGNPGVGLLVEDRDGGFSRPAGFPLLAPSRPDLPEGEGRIAFDDRGVVAAALSFQKGGALLLYTGRSTTGRFRADRRGGPVLSVGTARFAAADRELPAMSSEPAIETPWTGNDALLSDPSWRHLSSSAEASFARYVTDGPPMLHWGGGGPAWSVLPLEREIRGDFELGFDLWVSFAAPRGADCSLYVGLASADDGVFARVKRDSTCLDSYAVTPFAASTEGPSDGAASGPLCDVNPDLAMDRLQHVVLRRSGATLEVRLDRGDGCGPIEQRLELPNALASFDELRIGFGGDDFDGCSAEAGGGGAITRLTLEAP